jgi:hypothetical protein
MRPSKPPTSIKLQNSNHTTRYCPTAPLPPWVTDKPWWERLRDRQRNSEPKPGAEVGATQHAAIESPALSEKPMSQNQPKPIVRVQIGQDTFLGVYVRPGCPPKLPAEYRFSHRVVQKRDGSWCFLPLFYDTIPKSWDWQFTGKNRIAPIDSECPEEELEISETANQSRPAPAYLDMDDGLPEVVIEDSAPTTNPPQFAQETNETKGKNETKSTSSSDHPTCPGVPSITGSIACAEVSRSDAPISSNEPAAEESESSVEEIMNDFEEDISRYLVCSPHQRTVLALWILHTYCPLASASTPYLNIYSPVEQSGKSTCLGLLRALCAQPWFASGVPASTLTRKIIADRPTVLLDNWHTTFRGSDKHHITGFLLNSCEAFKPFTLLEKGIFKEAQVYCPKAFAGMASLPPTLAQRSIPIVLRRPLPQDEVTPVYWLLDPKATGSFTSWVHKWTQDNLLKIDENTQKPEHRKSLSALSPHQQACCQPLLGIAETLGGEWLQKARAALLEIFREENERQASATQLLSDVYDAFAHHGNTERIFTHELLEYLHSLDHRPWHEWNKGKPMTAHALSGLLRKSFNIYSRSQRRDQQKRRGYQQADFAEAWERYLPGPNPEHSAEDAFGNAAAGPKAEVKADGQESASSGIGSPDSKLPNLSRLAAAYQVTPLPNAFRPTKSRLVSMSQFKAGWARGRSILRQLAGKAAGLFVSTRT